MVPDPTGERQTKSAKSAFNNVTFDEPCPICGSASYCSRTADGGKVVCRGECKTTTQADYVLLGDNQDANGQPYSIWSRDLGGSNGSELVDVEGRASPTDCHLVYSVVLKKLARDEDDHQDLRRRGFTDNEIDENGYSTWDRASFPKACRKAVAAAETVARQHDIQLATIPGFYSDHGHWKFNAFSGLVIPVRDVEEQIVAFKIRRRDVKDGQSKYVSVTSKKYGGPSPGAPVHVPLMRPESTNFVRVTEGEIKADLASARSDMLTISVPGVTNFRGVVPVLQSLGAETAVIAFDADFRTKTNVARALVQFTWFLQDRGYNVEVETWSKKNGKGIDDLLGNGKKPRRLAGIEVEALLQELQNHFGQFARPDRPQIKLSAPRAKINARCAGVLSTSGSLFQHGGRAVRVVTPKGEPSKTKRSRGAKLVTVDDSAVEDELSRLADFAKFHEKQQLWKTTDPPRATVLYLTKNADACDLREVTGVVNCPIMRPDGSLVTLAGYDVHTKLFLGQTIDMDGIPARPTREDVEGAIATLNAVVCDFPFVDEASKSAWLALVFTLASRHLYDGPTPLFLVDGNVQGAGKGLLLLIAIRIVYGIVEKVSDLSGAPDELRKRLTTALASGATYVWFDNLTDRLDSASLDAFLTAGGWEDRLLGTNTSLDMEVNLILMATANNLQMGKDTPRRTQPIIIRSPLENPDKRTGFRHKRLKTWVSKNRPTLLAAVFTVMRSYLQAGSPVRELSEWGSFEGWSDFVRGLLTWAGCVDPEAARQHLRERADVDRQSLRVLLDDIHKLQKRGEDRGGLPQRFGAQQLLTYLNLNREGLRAGTAGSIQNALAALLKVKPAELTATAVGSLFAQHEACVVGGLQLVRKIKGKSSFWAVAPAPVGHSGTTKAKRGKSKSRSS